MKKLFKYSIYVWIGILLTGCSTDFNDEVNLSDVSVEQETEEFGKQMAGNLRFVVTQMNKNGDDFNDLAKVKAAIAEYLPQHTHTGPISIEEMDNSLQSEYRFTPVQITFLEKIREAQAKSHSANELMQYLKEIMKEIQTTVPEIQQKNLLKMTVALYYTVKEMDALLKEGLMPVNLNQPQYIRLRSGSEDHGNIWSALLAGVCVSTGSIGEALLATLEVAAAAAGYYLVAVAGCLLLTGDTENTEQAYCLGKYDECSNTPMGNPNSGGYGYTMCGRCLEFCKMQGYWDCPRPI